MECLDTESGIAHLRQVAVEHLVGRQQQQGAYALASETEGVVDGGIQLFRLGKEPLGVENLLDLGEERFHLMELMKN